MQFRIEVNPGTEGNQYYRSIWIKTYRHLSILENSNTYIHKHTCSQSMYAFSLERPADLPCLPLSQRVRHVALPDFQSTITILRSNSLSSSTTQQVMCTMSHDDYGQGPTGPRPGSANGREGFIWIQIGVLGIVNSAPKA